MPLSRRNFIINNLLLSGAAAIVGLSFINPHLKNAKLSGHVWVYASRFPPNWDCSPVLEEVFADFRYAGLEGVELMDVIQSIYSFKEKKSPETNFF
jgi:hypothetical protein